MQLILRNDKEYQAKLSVLYHRAACPAEIEERASAILREVRESGDRAILLHLHRFDGVDLAADCLRVTEAEIAEARRLADSATKKAVRTALTNIRAFARKTLPKNWKASPRSGVMIGELFQPMQRVGCYVPGGTAPLVSSAIHTIAVAKTAGVPEIVAMTPPMKDGRVNPGTLYALAEAGATEIYRIGGASAIGAMAYGTETVKAVDKIVGPGNAYVAAAKKLVFGTVAIDMVAGPSEIMVIADGTGDPALIAADVLSQAEHGSGLEQAVFVSDDRALLEKVRLEIYEQAKTLSRQGPIGKVLEHGVFLIEATDMHDAAAIAGDYAPEHLEIQCEDAEKIAREVKAAGAMFLGKWTPEPAGDFTAGPSHVLPTGGTARYFHGISGMDFMRRSSLIRYTRAALMKELPAIEKFASLEGLDAHGRSASIRKTVES